jgi:hypothetical protein
MFVLEKGGFQVLNIYLYDLLLKKKKKKKDWNARNMDGPKSSKYIHIIQVCKIINT